MSHLFTPHSSKCHTYSQCRINIYQYPMIRLSSQRTASLLPNTIIPESTMSNTLNPVLFTMPLLHTLSTDSQTHTIHTLSTFDSLHTTHTLPMSCPWPPFRCLTSPPLPPPPSSFSSSCNSLETLVVRGSVAVFQVVTTSRLAYNYRCRWVAPGASWGKYLMNLSTPGQLTHPPPSGVRISQPTKLQLGQTSIGLI